MSLSIGATGTSGTGHKSQRIASQRKILDEASRRRRARKALESLEADNFHEDPHADLVMSKKALNLFQEDKHVSEHSSPSIPSTVGSNSQISGSAPSITSSKATKRRLKTAEYYKQRLVRINCFQALTPE